jgi:hypothetical protein
MCDDVDRARKVERCAKRSREAIGSAKWKDTEDRRGARKLADGGQQRSVAATKDQHWRAIGDHPGDHLLERIRILDAMNGWQPDPRSTYQGTCLVQLRLALSRPGVHDENGGPGPYLPIAAAGALRRSPSG